MQDCGKPWYVENYIAIFAAIRARYPHMRLISNCDMEVHAPTDIFDWHMYTDSQNMFDRRHDFDNIPNIQDKQVFASEYAVFDDPAGHPIEFPGNLKVSCSYLSFFQCCPHSVSRLLLGMARFADWPVQHVLQGCKAVQLASQLQLEALYQKGSSSLCLLAMSH